MDPALGVVVEEGGGHLAAAPAEGRLNRWWDVGRIQGVRYL